MKVSSLIIFLLLSAFSCRTKEEWKTRSIYQIITDPYARTSDTGICNFNKYCGGNYRGIINKLDYIKGMGFNAVGISPIVENLEDSYHDYHITNFYKLNDHFGSEDDFKEVISTCHKNDIWVMVDVNVNHVAPIGTNYEKIYPFNSSEHYNDWGNIYNWNNQMEVENCRIAEMPDLKQENDWVTETLLEWIHNLIQKYDIDGIRIETVIEVLKWFWDQFLNSAGVFQICVVFSGNPGYVAAYQRHLDSVFNYPLYYAIRNSFCGSFNNLKDYWLHNWNIFLAPEYLRVFVENHDNDRFLFRHKDVSQFTNAIIFSFLWEGISVVYYGGEQYFSGGYDLFNREPLWDG